MPKVVKIDENRCIGCTKCIKACPTDAIIGAHKQLHGVLTNYCIGCMRCLPPCPVDCIDIVEIESRQTSKDLAAIARKRIQARKERLQRKEESLNKVLDAPISIDFNEMIARLKN